MLLATSCFGQKDTLRIHFRYGSKPARGYKEIEKVWFGGLKGGHVSLELEERVLDFLPGKNPLFPNHAQPSGDFKINDGLYWNQSNDNKHSVVSIPITQEQKEELMSLFAQWDSAAPYDYAILGMRCASATYDVLSRVGLVKPLSRKWNIVRHFYPKLLRKRIYKMAGHLGWPVRYYEGRRTRKWESDRGIF